MFVVGGHLFFCRQQTGNWKKELQGEDMSVEYVSTRNKSDRVTASQAVLQGLAPDGGLYVPTELPKLDVSPSSGFSTIIL